MLIEPVLLKFKFDGFADLPTRVDQEVCSEVQTDCNGNKWKLLLYPGGLSRSTYGCIGVSLDNVNEEPFDISYGLAIKDANGTVAREYSFHELLQPGELLGCDECMEHTEILDPNKNILKDGALCVDVTIQVKTSLTEDLYECKFGLADKMERLLESGENSDATIKVGDETFKVHSCIIRNNAPILANLLNQIDQNPDTVVEDTLPEVFHHILRFVYTGISPSRSDMKKFGEELIDAANRYELIELKVDVENVLVRERVMNKENVSDWILFADAQCCPVLKEYAISYFRLHSLEILKSEHSRRLRESGEVLSEIMILMVGGNGGMTATELRKELGKRGLDVDGSKETLAARLESAKRQRTE